MCNLLRVLATHNKRSELLVLPGILLAALTAGSLFAQSTVTIDFNNVGLNSLQVNGTQFLAYGDFRLDGLTFVTPSGQSVAGDLTGTLSVSQQTVTRTSSWGTITTHYTTNGNQLDVIITVNNQSPNTIQDLWMEPFGIQFPSTPLEYLYPLVVNSIGQPAIQQTTYNSGVMVLAANDITKPIQLGFPWPYNSPTNTIFPLQLNTGLVSMYPNQYQAINRPIPAGGSDQFTFSLRFGPPGSTEETLAPDIYQTFAAAFPMTLNWPDRRPIGAIFLSTAAAGWPTNPRGWLLDPTIDVFTPAGVADLQTRILALADDSIAILKSMNAQGMVTWDIEGQQFPDPTSYVCDPTQFMATAPEMAGIADAYFQKFIAAGLRVGVCIRPQQFVLSPDGTSATQNFVSDPTQLMINKVAYAVNRWGASLFYVDSNVNLTDPNPIPASIFQTLQAAFPNVLFLPEHSNMQYYAYTAPYKQLNQGNTSTTPDVRTAYPSSFTVIYTADGPITQDFNQLVTAVSGGDVLLFRGWFDDPQNAQDQSIYQQASLTTSHQAPTVTFASPTNGSTASGSITLSATAMASGTATIASVQFAVDSNTLGTVSAAPYSMPLNTTTLTNGSHTLTAVVRDTLGNSGSASISITVSNATPPPTVSFASPANGSTVSNTIIVSATAAASGSASIASVQFAVDSNTLGTVSAAPYSMPLNTTSLTNGNHTLTAVVRDTLGNSGSASISITVSNTVTAPPTSGTAGTFSYQRSITIAPGQVPNSDQTNFPVLIKGVYPYLATTANGGHVQNVNGDDIIFTSDAAGSHLLNWEIESYNPSTGFVAFWVQIPKVSHTANTVFYMFYGNTSISTFQGNKSASWDLNYAAVYHMDDDAASPSVADSTSNGNTGDATVNSSNMSVPGEISGALGFNGANEAIGAGRGSSFGITGAITLEAWINANSMPSLGNQSYVLGKGYNGTNEAYFLRLETNYGGVSYVEAGTFSFPNSYQAQAQVSGFSGGWHHVVGTYNGVWNIYVDGVKTTSNQTQAPLSSASEQFTIGAQDSTGTMKNYFNGAIDEVRVSNIARSSDWISAEFNNQGSPSAFYNISAEQSSEVAVTFASPANGNIISNTMTVSATATASGTATIASVQFAVDGNNLGTVSSAPYSLQLNTTNLTNGSHTLTAVALDTLGNSGSASITITVSNATAPIAPVVPVAPPSVIFASPSNGSVVSNTIMVSAAPVASGTATIASVQFAVDGNNLGTVSAAPYSMPLNTTTLTNASHTLTVVAFDTLGNSGSASIAITVSNTATAPPTGGTPGAFTYQRSITIAHGQVPNTDQTNFPVLIKGVYPYLAAAANGGHVQNPNGYDIIFTSDAAGSNLLNWEIESYNPSTGSVALWVQVPTVSHTADTVLYMFYGNPSVSTFQGNQGGTWAGNYAAVYHMDDDAASSSVADSTSNGNTGAAAVNTNLKTTSGEIGGALSFNGASDAIGAGRGSSFSITGAITLEAWINTNSMPSLGNQSYVLGKGYNGTNEAYFLRLETNYGGVSYVEAGTFSFPNSYMAQAQVSGFSEGWHHVVGTYNGVWNIYVDGVETTSNQTQAPLSSASEQFTIGAQDSTGSMKNYFQGAIDEVRVSNIARSSDWISTEYNNQSSPSAFYALGAEQASGN